MATASPDSPEEIGKRLKRLRYAWGFGDSPTRRCEWLGDVSKGHWLFCESGQRWLQPDIAIKLCIKTGVSTDWLYRGLEGAVGSDTMAKINAVTEAEHLPPARKRWA